jgi:hypothetical protein
VFSLFPSARFNEATGIDFDSVMSLEKAEGSQSSFWIQLDHPVSESLSPTLAIDFGCDGKWRFCDFDSLPNFRELSFQRCRVSGIREMTLSPLALWEDVNGLIPARDLVNRIG